MNAPLRRSLASRSLLAELLRYRLFLICAVAAVTHAGSLPTLAEGGTDWTFFTWASQALAGTHGDFSLGSTWFPGDAPGGLSVYANYPFLQIGPPTILLASMLRHAPADGLYLASTLIVLIGLAVVTMLDRTFDDGSTRRRLTLTLGGAAAAVTWVSLARFVHLDDAVTLAATTGACLALLRNQWLAVGLLTGLAAASKPWGVAAVALTLAAPTWPTRVRAVAAATAVVLFFWGPFLVADPGTLALGKVSLLVTSDSVPALFGLDDVAVNGPLRLAQILGGLLIASVIVLRGRWELALAAAFAWRLLLDPAPYAYYLAALATAVLLVDLTAFRRPLPVLSLTVVASWFTVSSTQDVTLQAALHLFNFGGILVLCCGLALLRRSEVPYATPRAMASATAPS